LTRARWRSGLLCLAAATLTAIASCSNVEPYYGSYSGLSAPISADDDIVARLLLIGDAGEPDPTGEPALEALAQQVNQVPKRTTVVFLGDNIYERGMPEPAPTPNEATEAAVAAADILISDIFQTREEAERVLTAQAAVVRGNGARAIFVPGNHDWDQSNAGGWKRILAQETFLNQLRTNDGLNVSLQPPGGCPGPVRIPLQAAADLIVLDTEWWLNTTDQEKPTPADNPTGCPYVTAPAIQQALLDQLEESAKADRKSIVAAHHPMMSKGAHSGYVDIWTHIFPFRVARYYVPFYLEWMPVPILGSAMVGIRACCSPSAQDMPNDTNRDMRAALMETMREAGDPARRRWRTSPGTTTACRSFPRPPARLHPRSADSARRGARREVGHNSGRCSRISNGAHPGFMQLDFLRDGHVRFAVIELRRREAATRRRSIRFVLSAGPTRPFSGRGIEPGRDAAAWPSLRRSLEGAAPSGPFEPRPVVNATGADGAAPSSGSLLVYS
jgi:hypothetical protein